MSLSEVEIANLALSMLGEEASVASLDPPEGSTRAEICARFFGIARDTLLEVTPWNFATRREALSEVDDTITEWEYTYAMPTNSITLLSIMAEGQIDDYSSPYNSQEYVPQPFHVETLSTGQIVIRTDVENAELRYIVQVTDTTKYPPSFTKALAAHLASMIAGPIIKGGEGQSATTRMERKAEIYLEKAKLSDASQRYIRPFHQVPWTSQR
jgi:hypothetical protein